MTRIRVELMELVNKRAEIEIEITRAIEKAVEKRIPLVEIILDTESVEMKKNVLNFLSRPKVKALFYRTEVSGKRSRRILVHFRHKNPDAYH